MSLAPGTVFLADCPARLAIEVIADKWSVVTLFALSDGPQRHGNLVDLIGGISRKMLTQTLRKLQLNGLVNRERFPGSPPRVEYRLTELGQTLQEPIAALTEWAQSHGAAIAEYRSE